MRNLKRALSLALASVMLLGLMVVGTGASYSDVTSKNNTEAIEVLQAVGIMTGDDKGNFNPDQNVTRNEMAVVMANLMDYKVSSYAGTSPFTDVPSWAEPYVAACYTNGIVAGVSKTTYGGSQTVTTAQASLMLMKALGYFQFQSDFSDDWQLATVKQGNKIDLYEDVESNVTSAMTRNDVAQLVLNTLQAGMVEADNDTISVVTGDVSVQAGKVNYNYITSSKNYAKAISDAEATSSTNSTKGAIVELGEKLYNGDLKLNGTSGDDFNRPANVWTYNSSEIGKYATSADGIWTGKVTQKDLYNTVGSAAYDSYTWTVYRNGSELAADDGNHAGRNAAIANSKTSTERVLVTGTGVLTEVFVDSDAKTVILSMIDTGVAKVTKVVESGDKYEVTVSFKTKVLDGEAKDITPDTKFTTDQKFAKDDIVVYTASKSSDEIESMAVAQTVAGKTTAVKTADYVTVDGTKYSYNYAYTDNKATFIGKGLYNIEDSQPANDPAVDKNVTVYLDTYGNAVAFEGKTSSAEDYLFVTDVGSVFTKDPSAKVVFFDGTEATVTIDKLTLANGSSSDATVNGAVNTFDVQKNTVYKYVKGTSSYDLEEVASTKLATTNSDNTDITKDTPSVAGKTVDNNTVFVDVENNKTWTGYKNVTSKTKTNVSIVMDTKDNVAEIVFIYGSLMEGTAEDDDYIILKGTGAESLKDKDNKTVSRLTDAYDINGTKLDNVYITASVPSVKGLYKILNRDGDDYITSLTKLFDATNNAGTAATNFANAAKNGVLTLENGITFGGTAKKVFAYNDATTVVVIELKADGSVDVIRTGDIGDIETPDVAGTRQSDTTGVYVMTVDKETDTAPLAESILVIVPNTDGTSTTPVVSSYKIDGTVAITGEAGKITLAGAEIQDNNGDAYTGANVEVTVTIDSRNAGVWTNEMTLTKTVAADGINTDYATTYGLVAGTYRATVTVENSAIGTLTVGTATFTIA